MEIALKSGGLMFPDVDEADTMIMEYPEKAVTHPGRSISDTLRWAVYMPTALGLLGSFRVEDRGPHAGWFNVKTHGIDPLVASVWALAVSKGVVEHNTLKCIFLLRRRQIISPELESALARAYECFTEHLLERNERGQSGVNAGWVHPSELSRHDSVKVREAMRTVESFQKYIYEDGTGEPAVQAESFNARTWEKVPVM